MLLPKNALLNLKHCLELCCCFAKSFLADHRYRKVHSARKRFRMVWAKNTFHNLERRPKFGFGPSELVLVAQGAGQVHPCPQGIGSFRPQNALGDTMPPDSARDVVYVGFNPTGLATTWFASCRVEATLDDGVGVDNEEQGRQVALCTGRRVPWTQIWPQVVHLD